MVKAVKPEAKKCGRKIPKVVFGEVLPPVIEILYQHPKGIIFFKLFKLLESRFKNGCFYVDGRPLHEGSGYRRVRTEILTVLQQFAVLSTIGANGPHQLLILDRDKRAITQQQLRSVLKFTEECSNSRAAEPRIAAKIRKVFVEYPKICQRLENEAAKKMRSMAALHHLPAIQRVGGLQ